MAGINPRDDLSLGRRFDVFVDGITIDVAKELTVTHATDDITDPVYGQDQPITETVATSGTVTMVALAKKTGNKLWDVLMGRNPASTTVVRYIAPDLGQEVRVWENRKNNAKTKYIGCLFSDSWSPVGTPAVGAPTERHTVSIAGQSGFTAEYEGCGVAAELVHLTSGASGSGSKYEGNLTNSVKIVPNLGNGTDTYALAVVALARNTGAAGLGAIAINERAKVTMNTTVVSSAGLVTIYDHQAATPDLTDSAWGPSDAYVVYIHGTSTPTIADLKEEHMWSWGN